MLQLFFLLATNFLSQFFLLVQYTFNIFLTLGTDGVTQSGSGSILMLLRIGVGLDVYKIQGLRR